jgi:hypothetical protein
VGSNLRFDTRLNLVCPGGGFVFFATGRRKPNRALGSLIAGPLFDKWFEERETQAAESWRIR